MFPSDVTPLLGTQGNTITRINSAVVLKSRRRKSQDQLNIFALFVFKVTVTEKYSNGVNFTSSF